MKLQTMRALACIATMLAAGSIPGAAQTLPLSALSESTKVDLGEATFSFHVTPAGKSMNVGAQLFVHRVSPDPKWEFINATDPPGSGNAKIYPLFHGLDNEVAIVGDLPVGTYDGFRLLFFAAPDGQHVDYTKLAYDSAKDPAVRKLSVAFKIVTSEVRVRAPRLIYAPNPDSEEDGSGTYTVTIPAKLRLPEGFTAPQNALWAMAKGDCGFSQVWVPLSSAVQSSDPANPHTDAPVRFVIKGVKPGIWSLQFGVFKADWGDPLSWDATGLDFEVGGDAWETKSTIMPPRLRYMDGHFTVLIDGGSPQTAVMYGQSPNALKAVRFVRGGNFGNALDWTIHPDLDSPGYFTLLGDHGCRFIRVLFNPDRYLAQTLYQHAVDQVVQNIWQAGEYPLIAPQDLPSADTLEKRIVLGQQVCQAMAQNYKGKSVWIEICNEPEEFSTWALWKPVAESYVKTIRGIDPNAFVIVPFELWSKDARGAAADPISDVRVDLYDGHAYVPASEVQARFGTAAKAGLPVLIGEYGGTDAGYMRQMDRAFQAMNPPPVAIAPWAFTVKGQDSMPLVRSAIGADLELTPTGAAVVSAFDDWLHGKLAQ